MREKRARPHHAGGDRKTHDRKAARRPVPNPTHPLGSHLTSGDVDHVVALEKAWCSGIRDPQFGADGRNHRASVSSVNRGKGSRDPREWWNTSGVHYTITCRLSGMVRLLGCARPGQGVMGRDDGSRGARLCVPSPLRLQVGQGFTESNDYDNPTARRMHSLAFG